MSIKTSGVLNTVDAAQDFFGIVLNCRRNVRVVGGERESALYFAIIDLDRLNQAE